MDDGQTTLHLPSPTPLFLPPPRSSLVLLNERRAISSWINKNMICIWKDILVIFPEIGHFSGRTAINLQNTQFSAVSFSSVSRSFFH